MNVSARQIKLPNFVGRVPDGIARSGARPDMLKLEPTESIGRDACQGYFFSRPLPLEGFEAFLKRA